MMYYNETKNGDYMNLKLLGRDTKGGITKKVRSLSSLKFYVIKSLGQQKLSNNQHQILNLLAEQNECPYIVKHYNSGDNENVIMTDFIENGDLQDYIATFRDLEQPIEEKALWKIFYQCLESIKFLRENKIIHRNIRLENFYLTDNMDIRLGNFRYCTFSNSSDDELNYPDDGMFYKSSDSLNKNIYDEYSDLFALGVVFYNLCFDQFPFDILENKGKYILKKNQEKENNYSDDIKDFIYKFICEKPNFDELYKKAKEKCFEQNMKNIPIESVLRCFSSFGNYFLRLSDDKTYKYLYENDKNLIATSDIVKACHYFQIEENLGNKDEKQYKHYINNLLNIFEKYNKEKNRSENIIIDLAEFLMEIYEQETYDQFSQNESDKNKAILNAIGKFFNGKITDENHIRNYQFKYVKINLDKCPIQCDKYAIDLTDMIEQNKVKYLSTPRYLVISLYGGDQSNTKVVFLDEFVWNTIDNNNKGVSYFYCLTGKLLKKIIKGEEHYTSIFQKKNFEKKDDRNPSFEWRISEVNKLEKCFEKDVKDNSEGIVEMLFYKFYKNDNQEVNLFKK